MRRTTPQGVSFFFGGLYFVRFLPYDFFELFFDIEFEELFFVFITILSVFFGVGGFDDKFFSLFFCAEVLSPYVFEYGDFFGLPSESLS
jgi:hypothetical protein